MQNQLIRVVPLTIDSELTQTVNARELHAFLEVGKDFSTWIKDQITRARLIENRDFVVFTEKGENPKGGRSPVATAHNIEPRFRTTWARPFFLSCPLL